MQAPGHFKLSLVIPVHNEEECVAELVCKIGQYVSPLTSDYEIIFVDDRSHDRTFDLIRELSQSDARIKCVSLSRNMGHQAALACGLEAAAGDAVITMDGDLQHPPSMIPELVRKWHEGFDVVNTARRYNHQAGFFDRIFSRTFYGIYNRVSPLKLVPASADFRLLDRHCVDAINSMREHFKFLRGMVSYIGFNQTTVEFDCPPRFAGNRSYTFLQSLRLAVNGILSFSTLGLKIPLIVGFGIISIVLAYFAVSAVLIATGMTPYEHGWASVVALIFLSIGLEFTFLGMFGLYLGKIFTEIKQRPLYFVRDSVGFSVEASKRRKIAS
jgi:dolichol-phosphate mannosyltransferase